MAEKEKNLKKFLEFFPDQEYKSYLKWAKKKRVEIATKKEFEKQKEKM